MFVIKPSPERAKEVLQLPALMTNSAPLSPRWGLPSFPYGLRRRLLSAAAHAATEKSTTNILLSRTDVKIKCSSAQQLLEREISLHEIKDAIINRFLKDLTTILESELTQLLSPYQTKAVIFRRAKK